MIGSHCRHRAYPAPGPSPWPTHCKVGVEYATLPYGRPKLGAGDPCDQLGHDAGRICPLFSAWTPEEIARDEAEMKRAFASMAAGVCPECDGAMERRESERSTVTFCPRCPNVGMRECRRIGEP